MKKKHFEEGLVDVVDIISIVICLALAGIIRYGCNFLGNNIDLALVLSIASYFIVKTLIPVDKGFTKRGKYEELLRILKIQIVMFFVTVGLLYIGHQGDTVSRLMMGYFYCLNLPLTYVVRQTLKGYLFKYYRYSKRSKRMVVITDSEQAETLMESFIKNMTWDFRTTGIIVLDQDMTGEDILGVPVVCSMEQMLEYVRLNPVDEVFIRVDNKFPIAMRKVVVDLEEMGIIVDVNIQTFDMDILSDRTLNQIGKYWVVTFARRILSYKELAVKRLLDIVGSLVGMVILGIAVLFVAPAIKLESPGPVFFSQTRVGKNGRHFKLYKFRSMYRDAEERKKELMKFNEMNGLMFKMQDDPRITKVGKLIRKTSIDELPQFWNVLKGDMSLVGTRPPTLDEFQQYKPEYKSRLSMVPGLTGMWQVSGRSDITDFDEVLRLDLMYIDHWSIKQDVKILVQTVILVLFGRGAI